MANSKHLELLNQSVERWNRWREENAAIPPRQANSRTRWVRAFWNAWRRDNLHPVDLRAADLQKANLRGANLMGADLSGANLNMADLGWVDLRWANLAGAKIRDAYLYAAKLQNASLHDADLQKTNLSGADLQFANLTGASLANADLSGADLRQAVLERARLYRADLNQADLSGANLAGAFLSEARVLRANLINVNLSGANISGALLVETTLERADLTGCTVYGVSAWNLDLREAIQSNLIITGPNDPTITVDSLEVAQFLYLLLQNQKIRNIIDAVTAKVVLILGRFTEERKAVLDGIREELRSRDLVPVLFDFERPASKDVTGTVETLARMARFVIADLTDPSSIPHELATIVRFLRTTPLLPLRLVGSGGYSMFDDLQRSYSWVLDTYEYDDAGSLLSALPKVIAPASEMADRLRKTP